MAIIDPWSSYDGKIAKLLLFDSQPNHTNTPHYCTMASEEEVIARLKPGCICKGVKLYKVIQAIENGASTYEEVARQTGIGGGSCDSRRCGEKVKMLLELHGRKSS
ncbi:MAG: (2Fe-2S)-binding protein [Thermodesulfobacteriota bacterium]